MLNLIKMSKKSNQMLFFFLMDQDTFIYFLDILVIDNTLNYCVSLLIIITNLLSLKSLVHHMNYEPNYR